MKNNLTETKFVSKAELISKIKDEFVSSKKIIRVPDFTVKYVRTNVLLTYKNISFEVSDLHFSQDIPYLIMDLESGFVVEGRTEYNLLNNAAYSDYIFICKRAFRKWKYYGIDLIKVKFSNDYYDVDL